MLNADIPVGYVGISTEIFSLTYRGKLKSVVELSDISSFESKPANNITFLICDKVLDMLCYSYAPFTACFQIGFLLDSFFDLEDGGISFLRNVG
jgi:hypothetical protein